MSAACVFCKIIANEAPATIVGEWIDTGTIAIVPLNPVTEGHILVLPKEHVEDALQFPDVTAMTMRRAAMLATRPCNLITSVGVEASQSVFHLHVHVIPRREGDGLLLPWPQATRR